MAPTSMDVLRPYHHQPMQLRVDPLPFARSYQLEALEKAIKQNTIVFLETGSGKTLIAIMLLRSYAYLLRKPSPYVAIFLVPQVVLVAQQAEAVKLHTDLNVGKYWGDMGVDYWDAAAWKNEIDEHEVLVMTPAILLSALRHSFLNLCHIKILILDECHHARGRHPYACIMTEYYHRLLRSKVPDLPRIFGMTASPVKSKGGKSDLTYWKDISDLEALMNSKVYTCATESALADVIPISTPKFKFYKHKEIPYAVYDRLFDQLKRLKEKAYAQRLIGLMLIKKKDKIQWAHILSVDKSDFTSSVAESTRKKISKIFTALLFCLDDLGVWLALKAAECLSCNETEMLLWEKLDVFGEAIVKSFSMEAFETLMTCIPTGPCWSIGDNVRENVDMGLLTEKVSCLVEYLLEYRALNDMRCIVFVERVITALVLHTLLNELLPKHNSWKAQYIAGNNSGLQSQTRKKQNEIVEEFREGLVNIIVATSILEEGLDIQSCNLVIRFDPSATICSFIQSRGRARMQNSEYLLMVKSGDFTTHSRLEKYLSGGDVMRREAVHHSALPCSPFESDLLNEEFYCVQSTGATVSVSSSIGLIYFYCSRLPSDGYFKPTPRWDAGSCTLHLPKSCPVQTICVEGDGRILKKLACLEACKQLHKIGALTDNLVPDMVLEEAGVLEYGNQPFDDEQPCYAPPQLINCLSNVCKRMYHCYLIDMKQHFNYEVPVKDIILAMRSEMDLEIRSPFELNAERGSLTVNFTYVGVMHLSPEQVLLCRRFQVTLFRILLDHNLNKLTKAIGEPSPGDNFEIDYLVLPAAGMHQRPSTIDWESVTSVLFSYKNVCMEHVNNTPQSSQFHSVETKNGSMCTCKLRNSLVYCPHNDRLYCITGLLDLNGNSRLTLKDGGDVSYKEYYRSRHGMQLHFEEQKLLRGRHMFLVHNYLTKCRQRKDKELSGSSTTRSMVELPPELCVVIMSPLSISTIYSFTFVPSIMHRLESLLSALNLKRMHLDHCMQNDVPTFKVLEAITTKKCQEPFHLESLETLGDSFLKYAVSQQLFNSYQHDHEGLLSIKKQKIISNAALSALGCACKLSGFIRNDVFDPNQWIVPGDKTVKHSIKEDWLCDSMTTYVIRRRKLKRKIVADVVEALIGVFLCTGGENAALSFMSSIGIKIDFTVVPYERQRHCNPGKLVNVHYLESMLNYSFQDTSLLLEALTHGSYMLPEIPRCYQRLEFLGDAVLDYLITLHLYNKYPGVSPGELTDMRAASVNNDCYARAAIKAELHKQILHSSPDLHKHIITTLNDFEKLSSETTFGWETETSYPKVLGDVIESLAGAILVDSGYRKETVFKSIRPLLEPLITPETVKIHPVRELYELCQRENYNMKKEVICKNNGVAFVTIEVEASGCTYKHTTKLAADKKMAKKIACKELLMSLKGKLATEVQ